MEECYTGADVMERSCAVARGKDINMARLRASGVSVGPVLFFFFGWAFPWPLVLGLPPGAAMPIVLFFPPGII
jgi:hypothetical protein